MAYDSNEMNKELFVTYAIVHIEDCEKVYADDITEIELAKDLCKNMNKTQGSEKFEVIQKNWGMTSWEHL